MVTNSYNYVMALYHDDGSAMGEYSIMVDWEPAVECTRLSALRQGRLSPADFGVGASVEPAWRAASGPPQVTGFRVTLNDTSQPGASEEFNCAYFASTAQALSAGFIKDGTLKAGQHFRYAVFAFPAEQREHEGRPSRITVREAPCSLSVRAGTLASFKAPSLLHGEPCESDMPVFIKRSVLDEATKLVREADATETGGILIGQIYHDAEEQEIFIDIAAQLTAQHVESQSASLTLTGETWAAARDAIKLRGRDEVILGWWHSHPAKTWCLHCAPEKRSACSLQSCFFSTADTEVHATAFPRSYSVALVITDADAGLQYDLYGWRSAAVARRGFYLLTDDLDVRGEHRKGGLRHAAIT